MLKYTGHVLVDVGVATITAFSGKQHPEQLTEQDLDNMADYIETEYVRNPLKSFLTVAFPNSGFTQPAYEKQPEKRQIYAERVLRGYRSDTPTLDVPCVFTGEPAVAVSFDVKGELKPGHTFRQHIPLITGEGVINFHPYGVMGLPVSGKVMLALQALPLGCAKCGGRLLAVHSDNNEITLHFAARYLEANMKALQLAQQEDSTKMPEAHRAYRTLLIETLLDARRMQSDARQELVPFSITAYHITNSGQGADLDIYHLPMQLVEFLREVNWADNRQEWLTIVNRAWEIEPPKKGHKESAEPFEPRRNYLYEDLFLLPDKAAHFVRTYFLRWPLRRARNGLSDPRQDYSPRSETQLVCWNITAIFLRRILYMNPDRVEQIRNLGDRLAEYVRSQNDRRFLRSFFNARYPDNLRTILIRANTNCIYAGNSPLFGLDSYVSVFDEGEELARTDWRLARDLVLIRMIEKLYEMKWLGEHPDAMPDSSEDETETETETE